MTVGGSGRDAFRSRLADRQVAKVAEDRPGTALREPLRGSRKSPSGTSSKARSWRANARERPTGERLVTAASVQFGATVSESCALGRLPHGGRRTFRWVDRRSRSAEGSASAVRLGEAKCEGAQRTCRRRDDGSLTPRCMPAPAPLPPEESQFGTAMPETSRRARSRPAHLREGDCAICARTVTATA